MPKKAKKPAIVDMKSQANKVTTIGNHSYLEIDQEGRPKEIVEKILKLIDWFENNHPMLEVTGWKIEKQQTTIKYYDGCNLRVARDWIFGLWIDHKPKILTSVRPSANVSTRRSRKKT
jgi:hypothetical protein